MVVLIIKVISFIQKYPVIGVSLEQASVAASGSLHLLQLLLTTLPKMIRNQVVLNKNTIKDAAGFSKSFTFFR